MRSSDLALSESSKESNFLWKLMSMFVKKPDLRSL